MSDPPPAIVCNALRKEYGDTVAVDSLTLTVERGEIFGFLGPNGAGKTTSVKMLLGLVRPTAGEGHLLGVPISDPRCRQRVARLPLKYKYAILAVEIATQIVYHGGWDLDVESRLKGFLKRTPR
jgi:ABC-2 type transport system ATP-binding protein